MKTHRHMLLTIALLLLCSSLAWGQERIYGPDGNFSIVVPKTWPRKTSHGTKYQFKNPPGEVHFVLTVSTAETTVVTEFLASEYKLWRSLDYYTVVDTRQVARPGASFQVAEVDCTIIADNPSRELLATLSGGSDSRSDRTGIISVLYNPREIPEAALKELLEAAWSFRLEDGSGSAPSSPPPTTPKLEDDDF